MGFGARKVSSLDRLSASTAGDLIGVVFMAGGTSSCCDLAATNRCRAFCEQVSCLLLSSCAAAPFRPQAPAARHESRSSSCRSKYYLKKKKEPRNFPSSYNTKPTPKTKRTWTLPLRISTSANGMGSKRNSQTVRLGQETFF